MMVFINELGTVFWFTAWFLTAGLLLPSMLMTRKAHTNNAKLLEDNAKLLAERELLSIADMRNENGD